MTASTKVALLAPETRNRESLVTILKNNGVEVVLSGSADRSFVQRLQSCNADVLLISINDDIGDDEDEIIDQITESTDLPILFNDSSTNGVAGGSDQNWAKKIIQKIQELSLGDVEPPVLNDIPSPMANASLKPVIPLLQPVDDDFLPAGDTLDLNVWVLGASLGGPQAVRQFLAAINEDLPVAFILAQHIGANHVTLLAEQLNRVTNFNVSPGRTGHRLQHKEVILTPADKHITFTSEGLLALQPAPPGTIYSPSIDHVMQEVANHFGSRAGTIIFSGMGDDGAKGCAAITSKGGIAWAQDIASCVVSSMPDQARKTGHISYSGHPEQLAQHLYEHYQSKRLQKQNF